MKHKERIREDHQKQKQTKKRQKDGKMWGSTAEMITNRLAYTFTHVWQHRSRSPRMRPLNRVSFNGNWRSDALVNRRCFMDVLVVCSSPEGCSGAVTSGGSCRLYVLQFLRSRAASGPFVGKRPLGQRSRLTRHQFNLKISQRVRNKPLNFLLNLRTWNGMNEVAGLT